MLRLLIWAISLSFLFLCLLRLFFVFMSFTLSYFSYMLKAVFLICQFYLTAWIFKIVYRILRGIFLQCCNVVETWSLYLLPQFAVKHLVGFNVLIKPHPFCFVLAIYLPFRTLTSLRSVHHLSISFQAGSHPDHERVSIFP